LEEIKSAFGMEDKTSIFSILRHEHDIVKANLTQLINQNVTRTDIFMQTRDALNSHMRGEETVLYPMLEGKPNMRSIALASKEEHDLARQIINEVPAATSNDEWISKIRVLNDLVTKHAEVEENDVFPQAKAYLSTEQQDNLGREYTSKTRI
jgi:hemerythrin-like domain-containing protein